MHTLILALYTHQERAERTIDELIEAGVDPSHIDKVEPPGDQHAGLFKGLFSDREREQKDAKTSLKKLTARGVSVDEALHYATGVRQGYSLLIVDTDDDTLAHSARIIMDRHAYPGEIPARESLAEPRQEGMVESAESEGISTASVGLAAATFRTDVPGIETSEAVERAPELPRPDISFGNIATATEVPHSSEVTSGTESTTHEPVLSRASLVSSSGAPPARNNTSRFDDEFRDHYQRNYADSRYAYADFALAYRYGVALAEEPRYRDQTWDQVEPLAHQSWEARESEPWMLFRDAIRFGWNRIRGEHQAEPLPPRL
ncbi:hypothetical protein DL240_10925 [Lujinxingia litoralis]|uniref:General stress protein 17M-like domain-containing protein n=1 Tax=Lujinxingia litoralis TaxID=2211119 RepID=A0A328C7G2_9DELT|nr:hypothetical protein [Lujinxingia litoralis]RAL22354.1 hypothetical protein DL240_10925 [Lujinxingia litoralis]